MDNAEKQRCRGRCNYAITSSIDQIVEADGKIYGDEIVKIVNDNLQSYNGIFSEEDVYKIQEYIDQYIGILKAKKKIQVHKYIPMALDKKISGRGNAQTSNPTGKGMHSNNGNHGTHNNNNPPARIDPYLHPAPKPKINP